MKAFLSHSSKDKVIARGIADDIRVRGGEVWLDERELVAGQPLAASLAKAIDSIDIFVILLSDNSIASPWVQYEINQAMPLIIERSVRVLPLRFGNSPIPATLGGYLYADGTDRDGLNRALNLAFISAEYRLPLKKSEIQARYEERRIPEFCVRLMRTQDLDGTKTLGHASASYVSTADYFEQCGRPLREILENLFYGLTLDDDLHPEDEFSAVVFEAGQLYKRKIDLLPGTWKSVYRVITDPRRMGVVTPREELLAELGRPPRDYWSDERDAWFDHVRTALQNGGYPLSEDEAFLANKFGIISMCFRGDGRGGAHGSRIFFAKNVQLSELRWWRVDLGRVTGGNTLN